MLEGSWLLGTFPREQWAGLNQSVGMIPMFPVPNEGNKSATMMGGWILSIPETSQNKQPSLGNCSHLVNPEILTPMLRRKVTYLPRSPLQKDPIPKALMLQYHTTQI